MLECLLQPISRRLMCFSKQRSRKNLYSWIEGALQEFEAERQSLVINIGAGGEIASLLERAGLHPLSIDIDPARQPDLVANMEDLSALGDATVAGVICIEVLEHVKHPHMAVKELLRVLKPGGVIIGSTPFLLGIHDHPMDYFRFTRYGLRLLFADFELLSLRERNGYFAAVAVLLHRRFAVGSMREKTVMLLLSPILIAMTYILELIDFVEPSQDGTTGYFFVFRKRCGKNESQGE